MERFLQITWCTGYLNVSGTFYRLREGAGEADPNPPSPACRTDRGTGQGHPPSLWGGGRLRNRCPCSRTHLPAASSRGTLKCSWMHSKAEIFPLLHVGRGYLSGFLIYFSRSLAYFSGFPSFLPHEQFVNDIE